MRLPWLRFHFHLERELWRLHDELARHTYRPGPVRPSTIYEPKRRLISAAPFRDRVVHHALCNVIEGRFERSFIYDSYANRVGKGTHRALDRAQQFARRYPYVVPCDTLARKIEDERVMWLVDRILASGMGVLSEEYDMVYFAGDDLLAAE